MLSESLAQATPLSEAFDTPLWCESYQQSVSFDLPVRKSNQNPHRLVCHCQLNQNEVLIQPFWLTHFRLSTKWTRVFRLRSITYQEGFYTKESIWFSTQHSWHAVTARITVRWIGVIISSLTSSKGPQMYSKLDEIAILSYLNTND